MTATPTPATAPSAWEVICLCADWCGTCREWRPHLEQLARAHPEVRFAWVDIEDEAEAMGDVDVETFPTLLIASGGRPRFFGPVLPQPAGTERLLASLREGDASTTASPEAQSLLARLHAEGLKHILC